MERWLYLAAVLALATAKPEMYKESEDFQYSRSSTDEGHKSGYYGAQRGNMGGNYERAHNMDGLAQHQLSSAVRQVEGELGDAASTRTGSVYTSANTRGIYGSGKYDLSNLEGRSFQEGTTFDDSHTHLSQSAHNSAYSDHSASATHSSGYQALNSGSAYTGFHGRNNYRQSLQADNLQAAENVHESYGHGQGAHAATAVSHNSGQYSQSGYEAQSGYDSSHINQYNSNAYRSNPTSRLIVATPVTVYGRPGQRVAVPVGIQSYDATHSASTIDRNAINSEAEVLSNANQNVNYIPTSDSKRYEASYRYRKQWEKHNTSPELVALSASTENPFLNKNSELYDNAQVSNNQYHSSGLNTQSAQSRLYSGYNANTKTSSNHANFLEGSESQHRSAVTGLNSNAYTQGATSYNHGSQALDTTNVLSDGDTTPRSYHSSYSYHKSWERQGDPYVIQPVAGTTNGLESQRLTAATSNNGHSSHRHGTHYGHGTQADRDCDESGLTRVTRSAPNQYETYKQDQFKNDFQDMGQETQSNWGNLGAYRNNQLDRIEDLGQQTDNQWEALGQQTQNQWEALGKQTQNQWETTGQQSQKQWEDNGHHLEELGQQTQNNLENTQNTWQILDQQTQNSWDRIHAGQEQIDLGQQTQDAWSNARRQEGYNQRTQQTDGSWVGTGELRQEFRNPWDTWHDLNQKNAFNEQQTQTFNKLDQSQNNNNYQHTIWDKTHVFEPQNSHQNPMAWDQLNTFHEQGTQMFDNQSNNNQLTIEDSTRNFEQQNFQQTPIDWNQQNTFRKQETQMFDSHLSNNENNNNQLTIIDDAHNLEQQNSHQTPIHWNQQSNFNVQETQFYASQSDYNPNNDQQISGDNTLTFESHNSHPPVTWDQGVEKTDKFEQNYLNPQEHKEENGQQAHYSWSVLDITNKGSNKTDQVRPVWEQSEDMHQIADKINFTNTNNELSYFNLGNHKLQNINKNSEWSLSGHNTDDKKSDNSTSFANLWNKIISLDEGSLINENKLASDVHNYSSRANYSSSSNHSHISYKYNSSHSNWEQNSHQGKFHKSHHDDEIQLSRPDGNNTASSRTTIIPVITSSTNKPRNVTRTQHNENVQPLDIGRGDIGPEEIHTYFTTTEKSYNPQETVPISQTSLKHYKTPEEIEALSLTKESDINISHNINNHLIENYPDSFSEQNNNNSENVMSVNKWLEGDRQHRQNQYDEGQMENFTNTTNYLGKEDKRAENHEFTTSNISSYNYQDKLNLDSQSSDFRQSPEEITRIVQQSHDLEQASILYQQSEDFNQNLQQQSETVWEQNQEEFFQSPEGQESHLADNFGQYERSQHEKDFQLAESIKISHEQQTDEFYHQNHPLPSRSQRKDQIGEDIQEIEINQETEDLQSLHENNDIEQPDETTTQKSGFWASVGNKLGNAKNKVTSWFKSS